jgi:hypothetical protein
MSGSMLGKPGYFRKTPGGTQPLYLYIYKTINALKAKDFLAIFKKT